MEELKENVNTEQAVKNFGDRSQINVENLPEFVERSYDVRSKEYREAYKNGQTVVYRGNIFDIPKEYIEYAQNNGIKFIAQPDPDFPHLIDDIRMHTIKELTEIQDFYKKHFSDIKNNRNLSEKEKVIAATMKLSSLMTYDHQAIADGPDGQPTKYSKASDLTSRNQYGFIKYGTGVCTSYAESMHYLGDMLGVDIKSISVLTGQKYKTLTDDQKKNVMEEMRNGKKLSKMDHQVNIVNFSDGTSYMLDMTSHDYRLEQGFYEKGKSKQSNWYFTDAKNFKGAKCINGMSCINAPQHREASSKCVQMSQAEIEAAQNKILQEVPSIRITQEMDETQRKYGFTYEETTKAYQIAPLVFSKIPPQIATLWKNFTSKFSRNGQQKLLMAGKNNFGTNEIIENGTTNNTLSEKMIGNKKSEIQINENVNFKREEFMNMLSNNGEYNKNVEECAKAYQGKQNDVAQRSSEEHEL